MAILIQGTHISELSKEERWVILNYHIWRSQTREGAALLILTGRQDDMERDTENKPQVSLERYKWDEGDLHFLPPQKGISFPTHPFQRVTCPGKHQPKGS